jgi:hypothetical protein
LGDTLAVGAVLDGTVRYTCRKRYVASGALGWWEYLVLDIFTEMVFGDPKVICVCSEEEDAQAICAALNKAV